MSDETVMVTFQFDQDSKQKLAELANKSERSMSAMVRWLVSQEYLRQMPKAISNPDRQSLSEPEQK
jgi:predicted transcriptional regulator